MKGSKLSMPIYRRARGAVLIDALMKFIVDVFSVEAAEKIPRTLERRRDPDLTAVLTVLARPARGERHEAHRPDPQSAAVDVRVGRHEAPPAEGVLEGGVGEVDV